MVIDDSATQRLPRPANRTWLTAGVLVTVIAILLGGFFIVRTLFNSSAPTEEQQHQSYQRPVTRLEFDVDAGDISVAPGGEGQVTIERLLHYRKAKPQVTEDW